MDVYKELLRIIPDWRLIAIVFCIVVSTIMVKFDTCRIKRPRQREYFEKIKRYVSFLYVNIMCLILCVLLLCFDVTPAQYLQQYMTVDINNGEELSAKIEAISSDLARSAEEMDAIQEKLESRIAAVEELKKEAGIAENMLSLSEEQVNAIQAKLNQELEASSGKSLWVNILISAFFFVLGLIATPLLDAVKRRLRRTPPQTPVADKDTLTEEELEKFHKLLDELACNEFTKAPK